MDTQKLLNVPLQADAGVVHVDGAHGAGAHDPGGHELLHPHLHAVPRRVQRALHLRR